jgi:hypothetical protein
MEKESSEAKENREDYGKRKSKQDKKAKKEYNLYKTGGKDRTKKSL